MATIQYQAAKGAKASQVTTATPAAFADDTVRVQIDFTAGMTRQHAIEAIDAIKQHMIEGNWPPA